MTLNPYDPPKDEPPESGRWEWPSVELILVYALGIPFVAILVAVTVALWRVSRIAD